MPSFVYIARETASGREIRSSVEAATEQAAAQRDRDAATAEATTPKATAAEAAFAAAILDIAALVAIHLHDSVSVV